VCFVGGGGGGLWGFFGWFEPVTSNSLEGERKRPGSKHFSVGGEGNIPVVGTFKGGIYPREVVGMLLS